MAEITFGEWVSPESVNPFIETVEALQAHIDATGNENASVTVIVHKSEAIKTRQNFAKAANGINRTARVRVNGDTVIEDGTDTGNVRFVFTLTKRHKARKGSEHVPTTEEAEETENVSADTETEEATPTEEVTEEPVEAPKPRGRK